MYYEVCKRSELGSFDSYLASLSSPIDSYLEDHILESKFHRIVSGGSEFGSFAIHNGSLLTQFHMVGAARRHGQEIFADILRCHKLVAAIVPTCDEFFLSHALDKYVELKKQALFFVDGGQQSDFISTRSELAYRPAEPSDIPAIKAISDSFVEDLEQSVGRQEAYVGYRGSEMVAIGLVVRSRLWSSQASIGMFTHKSHRRKGIGTETVIYLKRVCRNAGIIPIAGCAYGNTNSQMTLQAAGMETVTRLLRFAF